MHKTVTEALFEEDDTDFSARNKAGSSVSGNTQTHTGS